MIPMKLIIQTITITASLCLTSAHATTIAYWNFNDEFDSPNDSPQIVHNASEGAGTLYQQRADTDGNGKDGVGYNATAAGKAIAWNDVGKGGDNDAEVFVQFSTTGYKDIVIRFDVLGNADGGIISFDLKYDTNALVDVTDLTETEKALRESGRRFKELTEMLPEAVFETDSETRNEKLI